MTTRQLITSTGLNLNSALAMLTLLGMVTTGVWFIAPLRTLPADLKELKDEQKAMSKLQTIQTSSLTVLVDAAGDTKQLRRDVDGHNSAINYLKQRVQKLESKP